MPEVVFEAGASLAAIDWVEDNMRELEKQDFARTWGSVRKGLIASVHMSDSVSTATLGGVVMGIFGVTQDRGEGHQPWLALTEQALGHPAKLVKCMKEWVRAYTDKYEYLANLVPVEDQAAIDLLEVAGFTIDRDEKFQRSEHDYYEFFALKEYGLCAPQPC